MSYDTKCYDLAKIFLAEEPECTEIHVADLAQDIQDCIEDWIGNHHQQLEPHVHLCQQCDKIVIEDCLCDRGQYMTWCSANCRAAYDL